LNLFHWNPARVEPRHRSGGMTHLLPKDRRHNPSKLPAAVATPSEGVQARFL